MVSIIELYLVGGISQFNIGRKKELSHIMETQNLLTREQLLLFTYMVLCMHAFCVHASLHIATGIESNSSAAA